MARKALLTEAAAAVGLTKNALYSLARAGKVPHLRIGGKRGRYVFDLQLLEEALREMALANVKQSENEVTDKTKIRPIGR
ncbi:MAG: helix-turn-helix domain-containing protein [Clostridiales bacterium]|nr:helix-turn-helix domain-containing protein [Clostridiales bacterium]